MKLFTILKAEKCKYLFRCIIFIPLFLTSCSFYKNTDRDMTTFLNADSKVLFELKEDYNLVERYNKLNLKGIDTTYDKMTGFINMLNIYTESKETDVTITYNSQISNGNVRVILVKSNNEVVDLVKDNGTGSINTKIAGQSVVKCVANNATGNLKIDVDFGEPLLAEEFKKDGTYLFYTDLKVTGDKLTGTLYRIKVANNKVEKKAEIQVNGNLIDGRYVTQFNDDGWGNSGTVEFSFDNSGKAYYAIKINHRKVKSPEWGFEEGNFADIDETLPDFLNGL